MKDVSLKTLREDFDSYTISGNYIPKITTGLPRTIQSLCPECLSVIPAEEYIVDGKVVVQKKCHKHGVFRDIVFSDAKLFLQMEKWRFGDGNGFSNPNVKSATKCPHQCGICNMHSTHTSMGNVDLTARCNLSCPVCYSDSNTNLYEPCFKDIIKMMQSLREKRPVPAQSIQLLGGEPTMHPKFLDIVRSARDMGFTHIQVASNGIKFANPEFAIKARDAGLQYIYLQMDGVEDKVFEKIRGKGLLKIKLAVIESARKAGLRIIFVPTIVKGVNDNQIGPLIKLAFENLDVLSGISVQPIAFTGRCDETERLQKRFTLGDMAHEVGKQTGITRTYEDWFPLSGITPFMKLGMALTGQALTNHACHPHCAIGTSLFIDENKNATPAPRFLDLFNLLHEIDRLSKTIKKRKFKIFSEIKMLKIMRKYFDEKKAPQGLTFTKFLMTLDGYSGKKYTWSDQFKGHTFKTFFIIGMHFMDNYNYNLERIRRCAVHYSAPNGMLYPFCAYNAGPTHRNKVERAFVKKKHDRINT